MRGQRQITITGIQPAARLLAGLCLLAVAACKPPEEPRYTPDKAIAAEGLQVIKQAGCAACHEIPGVTWPAGRLGPSLRGFDDIGLIAGALPNTAENLAAFLRNAPAVKPGSTMPPIPITPDEARAAAAYLYGIDDDV
ncbi:c-type cytochrome [Croceibacterium ferulae]|uniref:c-type cytochrome n=1 Tax=Croceibacterium ferulae TaxID=1854641 RepID=UPI000EADA578|nr:c-type cytochrome [Croceibacterium ferulae]